MIARGLYAPCYFYTQKSKRREKMKRKRRKMVRDPPYKGKRI